MKQITQELKSGKMEVLEVPFPALNKGNVLIRNHFSVISAGTEGKTVTDARKGYIAKAKSRKKEVKQVIEMAKINGILPTYKLIMNKLQAPASLGYSSAGEVIAVGPGVTNFKVGDRVACGGIGACHADVVAVPINLCVKVPDNVDLKQAAFSTLASIAIQGIRQAEMQMGESCLIIGMGIIGQLTYKILEESGMYPIGIDVSDAIVDQSKVAGCKNVYNRNHEGIEDVISNFTKGHGADSVIITAGTSSLDPVEFAGVAARRKAKVVIVGVVPTGFSRPNYFKKELDLRMSFSFGPGRYDLDYEEKGIDYPIGFVRWTENRNMQSYVDLLASERLNISSLISHTFILENAPEAYDMILSRNEPFAGIVIEYDNTIEVKKRVELSGVTPVAGFPNVGCIGAGSFAQGTLMPNMKGYCNFVGVATGRGNTAKYVGKTYGFDYCAESANELFKDDKINTIFITTRHNMHAKDVVNSVQNGKHVFVEKPLAMDEAELLDIKTNYKEALSKGSKLNVMVGFNRRFAPPIQEIKKMFAKEQAKSITIRVNSGVLPPGHWINDLEIGGGRIIGEACHFIDLAMFLADSPIVAVSADSLDDANKLTNTIVVNLKMENGSVASVNYFANGNKSVSKEFIEVFCGGTIAQVNDFKELQVFGNKSSKQKYKGQNKGHADCVQSFLSSIKEGKECPIPFEESYLSMLATFKALQSISENRKIEIIPIQ
ncbi:MAG: Sorbitol dehydrogenase [Owenweeksia sp. TMED14]|nr:MAG: Sorbitol dehydrogenase [Owenweeksia sp. TMED14]